MGYAGGGEVFEPVARALLDEALEPESITNILEVLIKTLQGNDWDTEDESLGEFREIACIVEAFRRCGVTEEGQINHRQGAHPEGLDDR